MYLLLAVLDCVEFKMRVILRKIGLTSLNSHSVQTSGFGNNAFLNEY